MFENYVVDSGYDEMMRGADSPRDAYVRLHRTLADFAESELHTRHRMAQSIFLRQGITFTVYHDERGTERPMPFDFIPKIIPAAEWEHIERGLVQRVKALNAFLEDVYNDQEILFEGVVPRDLIVTSEYFCPQVAHVSIPRRNHIFLSGIDLIRNETGQYHVLEDNLRNPSGMAYVYQNRYVMRKVFPEFFRDYSVRSLATYFTDLLGALQQLDPHERQNPTVVLLTPGMYNSAYFDHSFLAQQMGIELVEGRDLVVVDRVVYMKTSHGLQEVDVIYRRIDDAFLDPLEFRADSLLGVPGLMDAYRAGNVAIANGLGNGVADDKAVYAYVPDMIRYYLGEQPILPNVPTYHLSNPEEREFVLSRLSELVVKQTDSSGGYNMLIGPQAQEMEIEHFRKRILGAPHKFVAQPTVQLSKVPTFVGGGMRGCHVDLRAFVIQGDHTTVFGGGLARVAMKDGSLIVNSSQGGGAKDTWVLVDG
jgi:uncharacterized circularly permuted ATP-grasp superfamily protein